MSIRATRVSTQLPTTILLDKTCQLFGHAKDISKTGCFVMTGAQIANKEVVRLAIFDGEAGTVLEMDGMVARNQTGGIGIELIDPPPEWEEVVDRSAIRSTEY